MDDSVGQVLCAEIQMEHGKKLGTRVDGQPESEHLSGAAQPGEQFVKLQVRELEMAEEALVQGLCVHGLHGSEWRVMVACRKPDTRSTAERLRPSASA